MPLPSPYSYDNWQDYASALIAALEGGLSDVTGQFTGTVDASQLPAPPADALPVYWSVPGQELFLADNFYVPPPVINPFQIDTQSLALASVELQIIADGAVGTNKLADLAVVNAKVADATILSAKIGDAQIVEAKIGTAAITSAKIQDLAVGTAKIGDAAITTVKIGAAQVGTAQIGSAQITNALMATAAIGTANIIDAAITTAKIGTAQISTALIQNAAIVQALIAAAAIGTAQIDDAAITNAKIGDAEISSAKIASLVISKITAGTLDAEIDMGTGLIRFTIGGYRLTIGKGFGTSAQFIMWFGPSMAENLMSEATAIFYLKTNGDAYFGGTLLAGVLRTTAQTTDTSTTAEIVIGDFASNGNQIQAFISYAYHHSFRCDAGTGAIGAGGAAQIVLEGSTNSGTGYTNLATLNLSPIKEVIVDGDPGVQDIVRQTYGGSTTVNWNPGAITTLRLKARVVSRTEGAMSGTNITNNLITQNVVVSSTEQP